MLQQREKLAKDTESAVANRKSVGDSINASEQATQDEESRLVAWAKDARVEATCGLLFGRFGRALRQGAEAQAGARCSAQSQGQHFSL